MIKIKIFWIIIHGTKKKTLDEFQKIIVKEKFICNLEKVLLNKMDIIIKTFVKTDITVL